ncbi:uncharacterized protein N7496_009742 [Penicillium cataractarum]|uniref:Uncharacterized protein n=1 Tax=Penicillium cataractarum TaxID=2100454 RepID=A0A9W9V194_9EURO|nr:uncharacterized protein N7496_009742 [Penicillium cataractarum]KAJ5364029.1 hypothetical protein N7496_009742 [Penicillium cataractarum]
MKFSDVLTLSVAFATAASASPMRRTEEVDITFIGAADAQFSQSFPLDGSEVSITNPLSISHISSSTDGIYCTFNGVDNSVTSVSGAATVDVGPPQTQVSGTCSKLWRRDTPQVAVSFIGAADAKFGQSFPLDGSAVQITNPLSISHIEIDGSGASCTFRGVDQSVTTVTGPATVDVGPPQTQIQGTCWAV